MLVNILGTDYQIKTSKISDDKFLNKHGLEGYCCEDSKTIVIADYSDKEQFPDITKIEAIERKNTTLRHEIVHAFLNESGLSAASLQYSGGWAKNEEMVDWFAIQSPKIFKVYSDLRIIDG